MYVENSKENGFCAMICFVVVNSLIDSYKTDMRDETNKFILKKWQKPWCWVEPSIVEICLHASSLCRRLHDNVFR